MITTDYEYAVEDDWKKYDHQDHEAAAAYYDEGAKTQPTVTPTRGEAKYNPHLKLAHQQIEEYERRINFQQYSVWDAQRDWEDRAFKQAMMHAAYAQAEAATRQAEVIEMLLETWQGFAGEIEQWSNEQ